MQFDTRVGELRINVLSVASGLYTKPYSEDVSSILLRKAGTVYQIIRRYIPQDTNITYLFIDVKISKLNMYLSGSRHGPVMGFVKSSRLHISGYANQ